MCERGKRFSLVGSLKKFRQILYEEIFYCGEKEEVVNHYKISAKVNMVDIRETERPHSPIVEFIFVFMAFILFTMIFKCTIYSMKSAAFDISESDLFINGIIAFLSIGLILIEFRKIYTPE